MDIELALHEGRYGEIVRYLDKRIDLLAKAVAILVKDKDKNPKEKEK